MSVFRTHTGPREASTHAVLVAVGCQLVAAMPDHELPAVAEWLGHADPEAATLSDIYGMIGATSTSLLKELLHEVLLHVDGPPPPVAGAVGDDGLPSS